MDYQAGLKTTKLHLLLPLNSGIKGVHYHTFQTFHPFCSHTVFFQEAHVCFYRAVTTPDVLLSLVTPGRAPLSVSVLVSFILFLGDFFVSGQDLFLKIKFKCHCYFYEMDGFTEVKCLNKLEDAVFTTQGHSL